MRKIPFVLFVLVVIAGGAAAQPGQSEPAPYPPPAAPQPYPPYPQPAPYPPPQPAYGQGFVPGQQPVQLTPDEADLLQQGEISDGAHVGGAVASLFLGFGVGQAVQGRYGETGWIFTLGEAASMVALVAGFVKTFDNCFVVDGQTCNNNSGGNELLIGGFIGLAVFRVWEVVDAFGGPPKHNRKVRELKMRLGIPQPMYTKHVVPYVNKTRDGGGTAGIAFHF